MNQKRKRMTAGSQLDLLNVQRSLKVKFAFIIVLILILGAPVSHFIIDQLSRFDFIHSAIGVYINTIINVGVITLVLIFMLNRMIIRPLNELVKKLRLMAGGDLSVQMEHRSNDEIGQLYFEVLNLKESIREMIGHINDGAEKVNGTGASLKEMMSEAMESLQGISSAMQQVSASIQQVTADTQAISSFSEQVSGAMNNGRQNMNDTIQHMVTIKDTVNQSADVVKQLNDQSRAINNIIGVITGIAEQTNLLALNAAIEAARAGEHGRGFAVVADEVRELAEQSRKSAGDIVSLVQEIGQKIDQSVAIIKNSEGSVSLGVSEIQKMEQVFDSVYETIEELGEKIQGIAGAVQEVSASTQEVNTSSQQELNTIDEVGKMADSLAVTSVELKERINRFVL